MPNFAKIQNPAVTADKLQPTPDHMTNAALLASSSARPLPRPRALRDLLQAHDVRVERREHLEDPRLAAGPGEVRGRGEGVLLGRREARREEVPGNLPVAKWCVLLRGEQRVWMCIKATVCEEYQSQKILLEIFDFWYNRKKVSPEGSENRHLW